MERVGGMKATSTRKVTMRKASVRGCSKLLLIEWVHTGWRVLRKFFRDFRLIVDSLTLSILINFYIGVIYSNDIKIWI